MEIVTFIMELATKYPAISTVLFIIGAFRVVFKPLMGIAQGYVLYTPNPADDTALAKFMEGKIYKGLVWFVDLFGSIKLPAAKV